MSGNFIYRHHVEPRFKLYSPREESFPIPLQYIDVSRTTHTNLDVKKEKRIDDSWKIDGSRDFSDPWRSFTKFTLLEEKPPNGKMWSVERLTKKQLTSRPDHLWPELWEKLGKNAKLKEKQKWSHEKRHLDNARKLRGFFPLTPSTRNLRRPLRMLARNRKYQWLPLCLAIFLRAMRIVGVVHPIKSRRSLRVFWHLQDCVWENPRRLTIKTILQEKETIHYIIEIWFTNLFLCIKL